MTDEFENTPMPSSSLDRSGEIADVVGQVAQLLMEITAVLPDVGSVLARTQQIMDLLLTRGLEGI